MLIRRVLFGGLGCCCPLLLQGAMEAEAVSSGRCSALQLEVSEGAAAVCRAGLGWKGAGPAGDGSSLLSLF